MAGKQLRFDNGDIIDAPSGGGELYYAPIIVLDCRECSGWTRKTQHSATQVECRECGLVQSNERLVDLNDQRL